MEPSFYDQSHRPNHDWCHEDAHGAHWFDNGEACQRPEWHENA